ncbi:MarR family transcriptional regulator [Nisaea acidiphila]|uniref:MarR family transcriptional regulator n=1 Tax=Nisaea acidiphila TaxID=1862145 RepID=A0A9J7AVN9_9PROT|nr:MarR family transcriptional regulator [Nisaea acidiphila]UUX51190.1 MarR family transcriptional regulator [Nisaea acidiphila]
MKDLKEMPGHLIRRFHQISVAVFFAELERIGSDLTPVQFAALETVRLNPGTDQATLAGLIAYDRTTITGVVDRLVGKGLLTRQVSETDRRARRLQLTDAGIEELGKLAPAVEAAQQKMVGGLDDAEAAELIRLLKKATIAGNDLSRAPLKIRSS